MKKDIIDIHAHILPSMDDGPGGVDQALMMVNQAFEEGVKSIIVTPHCCNGVYDLSKDDIFCACRKFRGVLEDHSISVQLHPGAEIRLNHDTVKQYDQGRLMTLNNSGRYLLLELPDTFLVDGVSMLLRQFAERGVTTVIAHPERNRLILRNGNIVDRLVSEGALLQITTSSLMGDFGKSVMKVAEGMVTMGVVSFIASDIHPGRRYRMVDAVKKLEKMVGGSAAHVIVHEEAEKMLSFAPEKPVLKELKKKYIYRRAHQEALTGAC